MRAMTRLRHAALVLATFAAFACSPAAVPDESGNPGLLKAGAGQHLIDLPIGHSTAGYAQSPLLASYKPADDPGSPFADMFSATRGMQSPPTAKVTVLDNGHSRLVIAKIDAVFVTDVLTERVIQLAKERLGTDIAHQLLLNATHTHDAGCRFSRASIVPDLAAGLEGGQRNALAHGVDTYSQESTDRVAGSVVAALGDALTGLRPAKFGYATGQDDVAAHDRRCENDWISGPDDHQKEVTVLRVDDAKTGDPIAVLFNYAIHGTLYGAGNRMLSVDAPGFAELKLEEQFEKPVVAMYLQGSAGDASPSSHGNDGSQAMEYAGWELARTVKGIYDGIKETQATLPIQTAERWVPLTHDILGYKEEEFYEDGAILCFQLTGGDCSVGAALEPTPANIGKVCITKTVPGEGKYQTRISTARIGDLALLTLPGEPTSAVGHELVARGKAEGFKDAVVLGYAQDHNGYILFDKDWLSGGYEPTISLWGWRFGTFIVDQGQDLLHEMVTKKALRKLPPTMPELAPDAYTPAVPAPSDKAPAIAEDAPDEVERLQAVKVGFTGGDPVMGTPEVTLQRQGADGQFAAVTKHGWLPVTNLRGYELPLIYRATPTIREKPGAATRSHRYDVRYEVPRDLPAASYRLHVTGSAVVGGATQTYALDSKAFSVVASTALTLEGTLTKAGEQVVLEATVRYPSVKPIYAPKPNPDWQIANYRLVEVRYATPFAPALKGVTAAAATLAMNGGAAASLAATFVERDPPEGESYAPGAGPGLHATATFAGSGRYVVTFPAKSVTDADGNTNGQAITIEADL